MTILRSNRKCLREYLVSADEAARFLKVTGFRFRQLVADGFITPANRKGFYRLGAVIDGYAASVKARMDEVAKAA